MRGTIFLLTTRSLRFRELAFARGLIAANGSAGIVNPGLWEGQIPALERRDGPVPMSKTGIKMGGPDSAFQLCPVSDPPFREVTGLDVDTLGEESNFLLVV